VQQLRWRAVVVLAAVVGAAFLILTRPARLGLDLRGGTQIVLEARDTEQVTVDGDTVDRTLEVLRRRVDQMGVSEPTLQRAGDRRVIVELPGVTDPDEAVAVIGRTAQLTFHPVLGVFTDDAAPAEGELALPDESGARLRLAPAAVTGNDVSTARAGLSGDVGATWRVEVEFRGSGSSAWTALTAAAACAPPGDPTRRIAIVLDDRVVSSPAVGADVACDVGIAGGATVITGDFTQDEAKDLALLIRAGALPVPVEVVEQRTIGPTLGDAAIRASAQAAVIGALLTIGYMIVYYRLLGVLAAVALVLYGAMSYAVLLLLGATLTLPGIAGFVLAIGMAVDANVLVYERIKEERAGGATTRRAAENGFRRAWTAIADSNATTLLAAGLLFFFASGAVRGFGITLSIGVVVSVFTALVVTRLLVDLVVRTRLRERPRLLGLEVGGRFRAWIATRRPDLLRHSGRWLAGSALAVTLAVAGIATQGLEYGLDFSGGQLLEYDTERSPDLDAVRRNVADIGFPRAVVQGSGDDNVTIRTGQLAREDVLRIKAGVEEVAGTAAVVREEFVGPTIGDELRRKAVVALGLALVAQLVFLAVRFRWTYGLAAVGAMFHDVVLLLGVFAWLGKELDGIFVAALLTVIGYSVNDSVVVFDRIRELRRGRQREPLREVANDACLQTIPRTINTGLGALFILVALYLLGGQTLRDFALALLVGIVVGTYSSVFTATPLAVRLEGLSGERKATGRGRGGRTAAPPAPLPAPRSERTAEVLVPASTTTSAAAAPPGRAVTPAVRAAAVPPRATVPPRTTAVPPRPRKKRRKPTRRR
jgi:SecD/SecF fusion protein